MRPTREQLAERRRDAGWTQSDLAAAMGVSRVTLARYESGIHRPMEAVRRVWVAAVEQAEEDPK